jgi:general secretion pathway protein G
MNKTFVRKILLFLLPVGALICFVGALLVLFLFGSFLGFLLFSGLGILLALSIPVLKSRPLARLTILAAWFVTMISFILWLIIPQHSSRERTPRTSALTQIENFGNALDQYQIDTGDYPFGTNGLQALIQPPTGVTNWRGPYLKADSLPLDPWKRPYIYTFPGTRAASGFPYDLISLGPPGANAPITNDGRNDF